MKDKVREELLDKLKVISETVWERKHKISHIMQWVEQFSESKDPGDILGDERIQALYLLSKFTYFGQDEIRALLVSLYRDLFRAPMLRSIRKSLDDTTDAAAIISAFQTTLGKTKFLGVGNPSESGSHLLYLFRQENDLPKSVFISTHEIFSRDNSQATPFLKVKDDDIDHYVFIDDICGSGTQAELYSRDLVEPLKLLNKDCKVHYLVLFGSEAGLEYIRGLDRYDIVDSVFELDDTFKSLDANSRIFPQSATNVDRLRIRATCEKYGKSICPSDPLGYKDGQLLMGFSHNTPDNTLPIFWAERSGSVPWTPMFKRYHKNYG